MTPNSLIREFNLRENQRIVGFRSVDTHGLTFHYDLQFVLMAPIKKAVVVK